MRLSAQMHIKRHSDEFRGIIPPFDVVVSSAAMSCGKHHLGLAKTGQK